jgi:hypothetical protein
VNDKLEGASIPKPHSGEVPDVARREAADAEIFSEHHDRRVDQAEAEVAVSHVNVHSSRELIDSRRSVRERAAGEIVHERVHRRSLVAEKVVDFRQHQPRNISSSRSVDDLPEAAVIGRALHEVVEQCTGVAD